VQVLVGKFITATNKRTLAGRRKVFGGVGEALAQSGWKQAPDVGSELIGRANRHIATNLERENEQRLARVPLGEIACPIVRQVQVEPGTAYRTIGVKWWGEGATNVRQLMARRQPRRPYRLSSG